MTKAAKKNLKPLPPAFCSMLLTWRKDISTLIFSSACISKPFSHLIPVWSTFFKINNSSAPSVIICCSIITEPSNCSSAIHWIPSASKEQVILASGGNVKGIENLFKMFMSFSNFPLSKNLPSLLHVWVSNDSNSNDIGTLVFLASDNSLFVIASSAKAGLRSISSSDGIPAISSELLSLKPL